MAIELSIILVNWNGAKFLPDCLKSIVENPPSVTYEIVVVDNASTDASVEWLKSNEAVSFLFDANFKLIESDENLGFGRANNLAIAGSNSPFIFILNPDTFVQPNSIDSLLQTVQLDQQIGVSVPRLLALNGEVHSSVWTLPNAFQILVVGFGLYRLVPRRMRGDWLLSGHWTYDEPRDVPLASGCAMMVDREMIEDVGAFDPDIFMYGEDLDWCFRIGRKGWRIRFNPDASIIHLGGESSKQNWSAIETNILEEESTINFHFKSLGRFSVIKTSLARLAVIAPRYLLRRVCGQETAYFDKVIPLHLSALRAVVMGTNPFA